MNRRKAARLAKAIGIVAGVLGVIVLFCLLTVGLFELWGVVGVMVPFGLIFLVGMVSLVYGELDE